MLYHADVSWLPGGFLGVDVFFVISGYLIATLLLREHAATGSIAVGAFWLRRARRLLPALFAVLAGDDARRARSSPTTPPAGSSATYRPPSVYVSNWWQIVRGESYFESIGRPPLLLHLWSLAIEEQFYVVAPLVARRPRFGAACGAATLALRQLSAAPWSRRSCWRRCGRRATRPGPYFGTDTRAAPLLLGVALAVVWPPTRLAPDISAARADRASTSSASAPSPGSPGSCCYADEHGSGLYRGGFLAVAVLAAVAVARRRPPRRPSRPRPRRGAPLVWLGVRVVLHLPVALAGGRPHPAAPRRRRSTASRCWRCGWP